MNKFKKAVTGALAALTLGTTLAAVAGPAEAQRYRGGYGRGYGGYGRGGVGVGGAVVAGLAGLAIGSAIAGPRYGYGGGYGYAPGYAYGPGYGYGYRRPAYYGPRGYYGGGYGYYGRPRFRCGYYGC